MGRGVAVLIPAYRPPRALVDIVAGLARDESGMVRAIVVVDDGSGPAFEPLFDQVEGQPRVSLLRHAVNLGKGAALKTGFNHILVTWPEIASIVTADADGQHTVADILRICAHSSKSPDRVVLGVRAFAGKVPLRSRFGNGLTRRVFRVFTGLRLTDTQTGLRGWPRSYCMQSLPIAINGYDFELECLLRANRHDGEEPIAQVPIETVYAAGERVSHFNPIRDSMRIYFVFVRYCGASVLAAVIDTLVFLSVHAATGNIALSQVAGRCVAIASLFLVLKKKVFRSEASTAKSLAKYLALATMMGFISYSLIRFLNQRAGLPVLPAKLLAEGLLFLGNFVVQRELIFGRPRTATPANQD